MCLFIFAFASAFPKKSDIICSLLPKVKKPQNSCYSSGKHLKLHFSVAFLWNSVSFQQNIKEVEIKQPGDHLIFILFVVSSLIVLLFVILVPVTWNIVRLISFVLVNS